MPEAARRVSIVGLGKLGAPLAAALANRGLTVVGVDARWEVVQALGAGSPPVDEPGLPEALAAAAGRLSATDDAQEAVLRTEVTFVVVPTPSDESGAFSLELAQDAFREIGRGLRRKDGWHLVVLTSTVLPGATRHALVPLLEEASGKRCGQGFGVCYSPAFIALGSVIRDFLNPDFVLVGESDSRAGDALEALYREVLQNGAPIRRMSLENAELAKIGVNTFVTTKIAFANMLADLCERIPGGDVDVVTEALGLDRRIGPSYLKGGLGYGGPCFPRDNQALVFLARALGTSAPLAEATDRSNQDLALRVVTRLRQTAQAHRSVAVLGLAYKPGTPVIEASQGVWLARALARAGARVRAYDPLAGPSARQELAADVMVTDSAEEALRDAEVVLVCTPDPVFRNLPLAAFNGRPYEVTVIDFWRTLSGLEGKPGIRYTPAGRFAKEDPAAAHVMRMWSEGAESPPSSTGSEERTGAAPAEKAVTAGSDG